MVWFGTWDAALPLLLRRSNGNKATAVPTGAIHGGPSGTLRIGAQGALRNGSGPSSLGAAFRLGNAPVRWRAWLPPGLRSEAVGSLGGARGSWMAAFSVAREWATLRPPDAGPSRGCGAQVHANPRMRGMDAAAPPARVLEPTPRDPAREPERLLLDLQGRFGARWVGWASNAGGSWCVPGPGPAASTLLAGSDLGGRVRRVRLDDGEVAGGELVVLAPSPDSPPPESEQLQDLAEAVDRARRAPGLGRLLQQGIRAAAVVHDLRNRLSALSLGVTRARLEPDQESLGSLEKDVLAASRACSQRLDSGTGRALEAPRIPLGPVVSRALAQARRSCRAGSGVLPEAPPSDLDVLAAGPRLQDALANLVSNAAEAAGPEGRVEIGIDCSATAPRVDLVVRNPGRTLHRDAFRAGFTRGGSGLGLSAVLEATERWGGWLSTRSDAGWVEVRLGLLTVPEGGRVRIVLDPLGALPVPRDGTPTLWASDAPTASRWREALEPHGRVESLAAPGWRV